ncbi:MAG: multiheme c-type cytochrome [Planctomycetota bacterium]|jgi:hypothetical protein
MLRLIYCIFILTAAASALLAVAGPRPDTDVITVFFTGNELGALKPCGCAGGQLGGLNRRTAVFNTVQASKRLIFDTGGLVSGTSEQDLIKFDTIVLSLELLGYDLVNLTRMDIDVARNSALLEGLESFFNVITSYKPADVNLPAGFTKKFRSKKTTIAVTVAALEAKSKPAENIKELFIAEPEVSTVNILIVNHCDDDIVGIVKESGIIDCLICPADSDEPVHFSAPGQIPLIVSPGRLGKYIASLQIKPSKSDKKPTITFSSVAITEDLPVDSDQVQLYKTYQKLVEDADLLEKWPRSQLPNDLEYAGSSACKPCHEFEYQRWSTKAHANAYATLQQVGSQYDPECVICHVVGMNYQGGFVSEQKTPHLENVGCENCHGPGSEHIKTIGKTKPAEPRSACNECHSPEHSDYPGNEQLYFEKIIHWREPNAPADVE